MAYVIKLLAINGEPAEDGAELADFTLYRLQAAIAKDGRFTSELITIGAMGLGPRTGSRQRGYGIRVNRVRLVKAKPYCGQHPGECVLDGRKKKRAHYLEWQDWIDFHAIMNRTLDLCRVSADASTQPMETAGTMWIRKGTRSRVRWDYSTELKRVYGGYPTALDRFREILIWNLGTDDQFSEAKLFMPKVRRRAAVSISESGDAIERAVNE